MKIFKYSKDRSLGVNIVYCVLSFLCLILFSGIIQIVLHTFIKNETLCNFIANIIVIGILVLFYLKDLISEFKLYKSDAKNTFEKSLKYYALGFMGMIFFNLLISVFLGGVSSNEEQVREMLFSSPITSLLSISIIAPISEELIFRKSLQPVLKNKWVYIVVSGVLFGMAHLLTNILSGEFVLTDLFYLLPYGSLGSAFALMDNETKTVFSSIVIHALHNTATAILLLVLFKGGLL